MSSSKPLAAAGVTEHFQILSASYNSPTNAPFSHVQKLPAPATSNTAARVKYLAALRKATAELQGKINTELTQRMGKDKAQTVAEGRRKNGMVDEGKEEENYGEEVADED